MRSIVFSQSTGRNVGGGDEAYDLFVKINLDHRLHGISDMNQFEELQQRCDAVRLFMLGWAVCSHLLSGSGNDMSIICSL